MTNKCWGVEVARSEGRYNPVKRFGIVAVGLTLVVMIIGGIFWAVPIYKAKQEMALAAQETEIYITQMKQQISKDFLDPGSAQFRNLKVWGDADRTIEGFDLGMI